MTTAEIKPFDNYEISPCTRTEEPDKPGFYYYEVCEPAEADVWTLYGHIPGEGVEAIADFATEAEAEEMYQRITGKPFGSPKEVKARIRLMHAGPKLLLALQALAATARTFRNVPNSEQAWTTLDDDALDAAFSAIAEATGQQIQEAA